MHYGWGNKRQNINYYDLKFIFWRVIAPFVTRSTNKNHIILWLWIKTYAFIIRHTGPSVYMITQLFIGSLRKALFYSTIYLCFSSSLLSRIYQDLVDSKVYNLFYFFHYWWLSIFFQHSIIYSLLLSCRLTATPHLETMLFYARLARLLQSYYTMLLFWITHVFSSHKMLLRC